MSIPYKTVTAETLLITEKLCMENFVVIENV